MSGRDPEDGCLTCHTGLDRHLSPVDQAPCGLVIYECIDCGVSPLDGHGHPLRLEVTL